MRTLVRLLMRVMVYSFIIFTMLFWAFEYKANPEIKNFFDVIWWWVVTSTTLGYGDIVPVTVAGRIVAIFTIFTGFFLYTNSVALIAESVHHLLERKSRGKAQIKSINHIVLCEYTAVADELIQSLPECAQLAGKDVVIISDLVTRNPYAQHYFVSGVPINPAALRQANIKYADYIFIFANLRFADPDVKTLHIASRVLEMNEKATIFVEMVDPQNELLKYASDKLIPLDSKELIKSVLRDKKLDPIKMMEKADAEK